MKAFDNGIEEVSLDQIGKELVNEDLMDKIGELCSNEKVSVGTVHFTLAYMIAVDIGEQNDPRDLAVGVLSIQQYIYTIAMNIHKYKRKSEAN